jgi:hypothetical protein
MICRGIDELAVSFCSTLKTTNNSLFLSKFTTMTVLEIKKDIINQIQVVDDELILEEVNRILHLSTNQKEIFEFNNDQINILNERAIRAANGNFVTDEQSELDLDKWLK